MGLKQSVNNGLFFFFFRKRCSGFIQLSSLYFHCLFSLATYQKSGGLCSTKIKKVFLSDATITLRSERNSHAKLYSTSIRPY